MKETILSLYNIEVLTFIKISDKVYKIKSNDKDYALKYIEQTNLDNLIEKLIEIPNTQVHLIAHVIENNNGVDDDYSVCKLVHEKYPKTILAPKFESASEAKSYISTMNLFSGARMDLARA